jgi:site-specific recombinase XerD
MNMEKWMMVERVSNFYFRELVPFWVSAMEPEQGFFGKVEYWIGITSFFTWIGDKRLHFQDVDYKDVMHWKTDLMDRGVAPLSIDTYTRALKLYAGWLEKQGCLVQNPLNKGLNNKRPRRSN